MDPQQRLILEEAYHCIEDAGVAMDTLRRRVTSVYLGITGSDYALLALNRGDDVESHAALGNLQCMAANRISHLFGFHGISLSLDAATASSLVAVHEAKKSLCLRESDYALAAAVNLTFHPWRYTAFDKAGMLSSDGQCKPFDSQADGFVYGEGAATLLLQRLEDALRDGNHVYGIIRGSVVNHCGHTHTVTAPKVSAQRDAVLGAWEEAGFDLSSAGYIEAHGTGTAVGDPVEIEALTQAFDRHTQRRGFCKIGSVKSNIGHLFSASGLVGLIKVLLMMRHRRVVKTLNIGQLNPLIDFADSPFLPALKETGWTSGMDGLPRRAGINAIGLGGVNAHVVVEEYRCESGAEARPVSRSSNRALPFVLSAKTPAALSAILNRWISFAASEDFDKAGFSDLCLTLATGRESLPYRLGVSLKHKSDIAARVQRLKYDSSLPAPDGWSLHLSGLTPTDAVSIARAGLCHEPFRRYFNEILQAVREFDPSVSMWEKAVDSEPGVIFAFAVECACTRFLLAMGVSPRQLSASGSGLWAALSACGMLSPADAAALLSNRRQWREVQLHRPQEAPYHDPVGRGPIRPLRFDSAYLAALIDELRISSAVLSELVHKARIMIDSQLAFRRYLDQWRQALKSVKLDLDAMLNNWVPQQKDYAFAAPESLLALMIASTLCKLGRRWNLRDPLPKEESVFKEMVELLADDLLSPATVVDLFNRGLDVVGTVAEALNQNPPNKSLSGSFTRLCQHCRLVDEIEDADTWSRHALANMDIPAVAPGAALLEFGAQVRLHRKGQQAEVFEMAQLPPGEGFVSLLVGLWRHGVDIEWGKLYPPGTFNRVSLPGYPFQRQAHWLAPLGADRDETDVESVPAGQALHRRQNLASAGDYETEVQLRLRELFAKELRVSVGNFAVDKPFSELGVNSMMVAALVKRIEAWLGEKLDPSVILEYPTILRLSAYLFTRYAGCATLNHTASVQQRAVANAMPAKPVTEMAQMKNTPDAGSEPSAAAELFGKVAVIGVACHFPGARDKDQFWHNLAVGRSSIVEVPETRWDISRHYCATREKCKSISKWGGFIREIEYFDPEYFGLSTDLAPHVDPLIRQFLETAVQTFADAGYDKSELAGRRVGVFVGSRAGSYRNRIESLLPETVLGVDQNFIASHVSHLFDLRGPNLVMDSACSSSLLSIHTACQSLLTGECELALAGGVDILLDENQYLMLSESQALSPDGRCFTFDERANGFVPGEGCGAVLLKQLAGAIRDGDDIYAIVDGSAANNDGRTMGVTTPNPDAQRDVIMRALRQARVSAADISYIEAHGTGTMIGDPIELRALTEVFRETTGDQRFCGVGSVKTNIGHLLCAAGVAGFIKVALALRHKQLPPTLNCEYPNPRFDFETSPFYPNIRLSEWRSRNGLCRAGVSSFGFAGTNVHAVLSEFDPAGYSLHYQQRRRSLPPVRFNKRRFWIERENFPETGSHTFDETEKDFLHATVKPFMELVEETL